MEINNYNPYYDGSLSEYSFSDNDEAAFNFSFLDKIKEITGYLLVHNSYIKTLKFKSLRLIRGRNLLMNNISVYIENNPLLETLNLKNLQGI